MLMQTQGVGDGAGWLRVAEHNAAPWLPTPPTLRQPWGPGSCFAPGMWYRGWKGSSHKAKNAGRG